MLSYPQMPVLRMATVTWPSFSSSPFWTLSAVGVASLIHRSWLGFVKTPMLGFDAFIVVPFILRGNWCEGRIEGEGRKELLGENLDFEEH